MSTAWNQIVRSTPSEPPSAKEARLQKELQDLEREERILELELRIEEARKRLRKGGVQLSPEPTHSTSGSVGRAASQAKVDELKLVLVSCMSEIEALKKDVADINAFISEYRDSQAEASKLWVDLRLREPSRWSSS